MLSEEAIRKRYKATIISYIGTKKSTIIDSVLKNKTLGYERCQLGVLAGVLEISIGDLERDIKDGEKYWRM